FSIFRSAYFAFPPARYKNRSGPSSLFQRAGTRECRSAGRARSVHIPTNFRSDVILYRSLLGKATNLQKISHKFVPSFSWRLLAEKRNPGEIYVENSVESVENPKTCSTVLDKIEHLLYSCHTNMRLIF